MNQLQRWLSALLAIQAILFISFAYEAPDAEQDVIKRLLPLDRVPAVTQLDILDPDGQQLTLMRTEEAFRWQAKGHAFPMDTTRIETLLKSLADIKLGYPLTTSEDSHERFGLTEQTAQRRLVLSFNDESSLTVLIGSPSGARGSHIRVLDQTDVYTAEVSSFQLPVDAAQWLDTRYLAVSNIVKLSSTDYTLENLDGKWALTEPALQEGQTLDQDQARTLVQGFENLLIMGLAAEGGPISDAKKAVKTFSLSDGGGNQHRYSLFQAEGQYGIEKNGISQRFTLGQYDFERLSSPTLSTLLVPVEETLDTPQDAATQAP